MLGTFGRGELEDAYGGDGMAVLDCKGKVHLNQVYLCLEQDPETHLPGAQVRTIICSLWRLFPRTDGFKFQAAWFTLL